MRIIAASRSTVSIFLNGLDECFDFMLCQMFARSGFVIG